MKRDELFPEIKRRKRDLARLVSSVPLRVSVEPVSEGRRGVYYLRCNLNEYVVRVGRRSYKEYERSVLVSGLLKRVGVPTPRVLGKRDDLIPRNTVYVETRIPGLSLASQFGQLSDLAVDEIYRQAGETLRRIHSVSDNGIGFPPGDIRWGEYVRNELDEKLSNLEGTDFEDLMPLYQRFASDCMRIIRGLGQASLLHGDFTPQNIFVKGGGISGILDFEATYFGDPNIELVGLYDQLLSGIPADLLPEGRREELIGKFFEGYGGNPFETEEGMRVHAFYKAVWALRHMDYFRFYKDKLPAQVTERQAKKFRREAVENIEYCLDRDYTFGSDLDVATGYFKSDRLEAALMYVSRAVESEPSQVQGYHLRGKIHTAQGNFGAAEMDFREALRINPNHNGVRYDLARMYHLNGNDGEARKIVGELLSRDPGNRYASQLKARL